MPSEATDDAWRDESVQQRFWAKVDKRGPDDCWEWRGCRFDGYGTFCLAKNRNRKAHRLSLEMSGVSVPDYVPGGTVVDHICRNRGCANPTHLRLVSHQFNVVENGIAPPAVNAKKTHCQHGHPFDEENTYRWGGQRSCKTCNRALVVAYNARLRAERLSRQGEG